MCGTKENKAEIIIHGPSGAGICGNCISISNNILLLSQGQMPDASFADNINISVEDTKSEISKKHKKKLRKRCLKARKQARSEFEYNESSEKISVLPTPHEMVEFLDQYVVGQDEAKKALAVAVYNHAKRISDDSGLIKKSNILMVGPSGCGKTLLAQNIAKLLGIPFVIADATSLTEAGYVGDNVESILSKLLQASDGDVELAERGIVYIDEIDKIARKNEGTSKRRDVSGEGVQHALLKIIEDSQISVPVERGPMNSFSESVMMNTENILFICGGAFEEITMKKEEKHGAFGFCTESEDIVKSTRKKVSPDMLVQYGMTPEFIGRLPVIVQLDNLTEQDLIRIMTGTNEALIDEYVQLLDKDGVKLSFEYDAISEIADVAIKNNTGARGLRTALETVMLDLMYDLPSRVSNEEETEYVVSKDYVVKKLNEKAA